MGQVAAAGVNPHDHLFFFNLRSYDRLNRTEQLIKQEKDSGISYTEMQKAEAWDIMMESLRADDQEDPKDDPRLTEVREYMHNRDKPTETSEDSIAHCAMQGGGKVSEQPWEGDTELEKNNFVQEELYIHDKVCIIDDRIAICGSANLNDRVGAPSPEPETNGVVADIQTVSTWLS